MFGFNPMELLIILVLVVVLFGSKRLPELGTGLGQAISNFKKGYREGVEIDVTPKTAELENQNPQGTQTGASAASPQAAKASEKDRL